MTSAIPSKVPMSLECTPGELDLLCWTRRHIASNKRSAGTANRKYIHPVHRWERQGDGRRTIAAADEQYVDRPAMGGDRPPRTGGRNRVKDLSGGAWLNIVLVRERVNDNLESVRNDCLSH